jgi:trehalose 6-phosphate synthase/phosphatase
MRLVIVSNRLPFTVSVKEGALGFNVSSGGLTTGLWSYLRRGGATPGEQPDFLWLGWPGATVAPEHEEAVKAYAEKEFKALPLFLPEDRMDRFYHGFCNKTLWPLFHYFPDLTRYEEEYWEEYKQVNRVFAEAVIKALRPDDLLWVHDYQLMLVPGLVRERFPDMPSGSSCTSRSRRMRCSGYCRGYGGWRSSRACWGRAWWASTPTTIPVIF